jgi:hypothetical protein
MLQYAELTGGSAVGMRCKQIETARGPLRPEEWTILARAGYYRK